VAEEGIGARLRELRLARGLSQRQLAKKSGVAYSHIGKIETDPRHEPRLSTKERLSEALGVSVGELDGSASAQRSWKADLMANPVYPVEIKRAILALAEAAEEAERRKRRSGR